MLPALYDPEGKEFMPVTWGAGYYGQWSPVPDVDHWAWWGWFIKLLGPRRIAVSAEDLITVGHLSRVMDTNTLGRACIATAHALGRWPGGEG